MKKHIIYIVEDNPTESMLLKIALQQMNHLSVEYFSEGQALLNRFREQPADIVVSDLIMPAMSGQEVLKKVRKLKKSTLMIVLSSQEHIEEVAQLQALGIFNYIVKGDHCLHYLKRTLEVACFLLEKEFRF
ncbi:response regulator [Flammeovirga sp. MY04]|uniref:response regulator n=1 Tax=Flammeovirga sp. MY04 TaxID=1191459 RepID=UPI000806172D|nr:response regulator [Flammeovirga sp. MY04]ANQ50430.1 response regulator [Flammeovirga sp. MY04]